MRGGYAGRRQADEFEALLSRGDSGRSDASGDLAELLEIVGTLRDLPEVTARPQFVADLRTQLVAAAEAQPVRAMDDATVARLTPVRRSGRSERRLAAVLGGFAVVAASGSVAVASQSALPGDTLYPMKRAIENAQTNLQSDDAGRAEALLEQAEERLAEVEGLNERGGDVTDEIAGTLADFRTQTSQASSAALDEYRTSGDDSSLSDLRDFAGRSMGQLTELGESLPEEIRPDLISAAQAVQQADSAAQQACPTCEGSELTVLPDLSAQDLGRLLAIEEVADATPAPRPERDTTPRRDRDERPERDEIADPGPGQTPGQDDPPADDLPVPDVTDEPNVPGDNGPGRGPLRDITNGIIGDSDDDEKSLTENLGDGINGLLDGLLGR